MKSLKSTGVTVRYDQINGWVAYASFGTFEHGNHAAVEGKIGGKYFDHDIAAAIDRTLAALAAIGVEFFEQGSDLSPALYVEGDGEDPAIMLPPNWRAVVRDQCRRLGWTNVYESTGKDSFSPRQ